MSDRDYTQRVKVQQLAGPGVKGLESDPPLYHFDLEPEDVDALIANPIEVLNRLGLGVEQGIAPGGNVHVITNFDQLWDGKKWRARNSGARPSRPLGCCYVSDNSVVCHAHYVASEPA